MTRALAALVLACALGAVSSARAQDLTEYTVRRGDTCGTIARAHYGHSRRYDLIHQANPSLGAMPHHLNPGQVLRLPVVPDASDHDATVTAMRRSVRHQRPSEGEWTSSHVGQDLDQGWRLSTGESSTAELSFRRSSAATVREQTLIIVYGTGARRVRNEGSRTVVEAGSILSRLRSLSGAAPDEPLEVETPAALATLREGESQVDVDASGATRVAVHGGSAATVTTPSGEGAVQVQPGEGTAVEPGQPPRRPRPLPRAPRWEDGPRRFVGLRQGGGTVRGRWHEVAGAARYRVEVARRRDGRDLVTATAVPATVREVVLHRLPPGTYYVRVATIDGERFEGRPAQPVELEVVAAEIVAPGAAGPLARTDDDPLGLARLDDGLDELDLVGAEPHTPRVPRYAALALPADVRCRFGTSDPVQQLQLVDVGPLSLTCAAGDEEIGGLDLQVLASHASLVDTTGAAIAALPRAEQPVRVVLDPPLEDVSGLTLLAPEGVAVSAVAPHPDGGLAAVLATSEALAAERVVLQVATADASHLPIAEAEVGLVPSAAAAAPAAVPIEAPAVELPPDPHGLQEAFGLAALATSVGLRDERRSGSGMHLALTLVSAAEGDGDAQLRVTGGARAALFDDYLRLDAAVPLDLVSEASRTANRGSRDVYFAASSRVLNEGMFGLAVEAGVWTPTAGADGLDRGRMAIAADFSLRFLDDDRLAVRTRQAALFDLVGDGGALWASAYGFDVWIAGPLSAGLEIDLVLGREDGADRVAAGIGAGLALDLAPVTIHAAGRVGLGDEALIGLGGGTVAVRGSFR